MMYLGAYLKKYVQAIGAEIWTILGSVLKVDLKQWRDMLCSRIRR